MSPPALAGAAAPSLVRLQQAEEAATPEDTTGAAEDSSASPRRLSLEELSARATAAVVLIQVEAGERSRQG
ncbi:MAG: hypothetical protein ACODAB_10250, partial [Gemmatimonadota bacterium]